MNAAQRFLVVTLVVTFLTGCKFSPFSKSSTSSSPTVLSASGGSSASTISSAPTPTPIPVTAPPLAPEALTVTDLDRDSVTLTWKIPSATAANRTEEFQAFGATIEGTPKKLATAASGETKLTIKGLDTRAPIDIFLKAVNALGEAQSNYVTVQSWNGALDTQGNPQAPKILGVSGYDPSSGRVTVDYVPQALNVIRTFVLFGDQGNESGTGDDVVDANVTSAFVFPQRRSGQHYLALQTAIYGARSTAAEYLVPTSPSSLLQRSPLVRLVSDSANGLQAELIATNATSGATPGPSSGALTQVSDGVFSFVFPRGSLYKVDGIQLTRNSANAPVTTTFYFTGDTSPSRPTVKAKLDPSTGNVEVSITHPDPTTVEYLVVDNGKQQMKATMDGASTTVTDAKAKEAPGDYSYTVQACNSQGCSGKVGFGPVKVDKPTPVTLLGIASSTVSWQTNTDLTYQSRISRSIQTTADAPTMKVLATQFSNNLQDNPGCKGCRVTYSVEALNALGSSTPVTVYEDISADLPSLTVSLDTSAPGQAKVTVGNAPAGNRTIEIDVASRAGVLLKSITVAPGTYTISGLPSGITVDIKASVTPLTASLPATGSSAIIAGLSIPPPPSESSLSVARLSYSTFRFDIHDPNPSVVSTYQLIGNIGQTLATVSGGTTSITYADGRGAGTYSAYLRSCNSQGCVSAKQVVDYSLVAPAAAGISAVASGGDRRSIIVSYNSDASNTQYVNVWTSGGQRVNGQAANGTVTLGGVAPGSYQVTVQTVNPYGHAEVTSGTITIGTPDAVTSVNIYSNYTDATATWAVPNDHASFTRVVWFRNGQTVAVHDINPGSTADALHVPGAGEYSAQINRYADSLVGPNAYTPHTVFGCSVRAAINEMYLAMLGRPADDYAYRTWCSTIETGHYDQVSRGIAFSQESGRRIMNEIYHNALGRDYTDGDEAVSGFAAQVALGRDPVDFLKYIEGSAEFQRHWGYQTGDAWLTAIYESTLFRGFDLPGAQGFLDLMRTAVAYYRFDIAQSVISQVNDSDEARRDIVGDVYYIMLGRGATEAEKSAEQGKSRQSIMCDVANSVEFGNRSYLF